MNDDMLNEILENLSLIESDTAVPKNVRLKIKNTMSILLNTDDNKILNVDKSIQELSDVAEDADIPQHTRMQVWSVVSLLESK
ncbi:UPF0147 family protein [Candidatus Woesearchaeota archaeon]|nr:MAG: hypothetical protein QT09_C0015G0007 [archaeon GW2011_AR18]MBS3161942.1 UPF0147 family protein [Candidatus Woesearchaeota archaeon]HIH25801.1 hypothetical protein [Nanoarchaeota archaeon]